MDRLERYGETDTVEVGVYQSGNGLRPYAAEPGKDVVTGYREFDGVLEQVADMLRIAAGGTNIEERATRRWQETEETLDQWTEDLEEKGFTVIRRDRTDSHLGEAEA